MLVHNGGCTRVSAFEKAYFQILFFSQKKGKKGNPRIEFSPANKKYTRIEFSPTNKKREENMFSKNCVLYLVCSQWNVFCIERVLHKTWFLPTNFSYFFLLVEKTVFTTPLLEQSPLHVPQSDPRKELLQHCVHHGPRTSHVARTHRYHYLSLQPGAHA